MLEEPEGAIRNYTRAIELDPQCEKGYFWRAYLRHGTGQFDKAVAGYSEAIRLVPEDDNAKRAPAHYLRGYAYEKTGQTAEAEADFAEARRLGLNVKRDEGGESLLR